MLTWRKASGNKELTARLLLTWKGLRFHPAHFRAWSSDRGARYRKNTSPEKHCLFIHIKMCICKEADVQNLELLFSKQATLIEIPDGFVFSGILSKSMSLSAGERLGGECTIYILNQKDLRKWAGQGTAQEKWGIWWKHINLSSSNLDVTISRHPLRGLDFWFPLLFHG